MVIHFRGQGLSLRTTFLRCKDYIVAVAKRMDSHKLLEILFCIYLSIRLSINVEFVHIKSLRYSACQMRTHSLMQKWHPINPFYVPNQTKLMINTNVNNIQIRNHI